MDDLSKCRGMSFVFYLSTVKETRHTMQACHILLLIDCKVTRTYKNDPYTCSYLPNTHSLGFHLSIVEAVKVKKICIKICHHLYIVRPQKKETLFYRQTFNVGSVCQDIFFFNIFFFFLVAKMTSLKKTLKSPKNLTFWEKNFGKMFSVIYKNFSQMILHSFSKLKKKNKQTNPKWKTWVSRARKTGLSFFVT